MKIKQEKQFTLPQLIEWAWENNVKDLTFRGCDKKGYVVSISINDKGEFTTDWRISKNDTFTVEVEEEITEDTEFKRLVCINDNDRTIPFSNFTIRELKDIGIKEFHAYIDGEFKCIWRNGKLVE